MKSSKVYIVGIILCCIFSQSGSEVVRFFISILDSKEDRSLVLKKVDNSSAEEENEGSEKETKEKEQNEEEKELNNLKYFNVSLSSSGRSYFRQLYTSEDSEIFSRDSENETPPPKNSSIV